MEISRISGADTMPVSYSTERPVDVDTRQSVETEKARDTSGSVDEKLGRNFDNYA